MIGSCTEKIKPKLHSKFERVFFSRQKFFLEIQIQEKNMQSEKKEEDREIGKMCVISLMRLYDRFLTISISNS